MFLIPLAITVGDFFLMAPSRVGMMLAGATLMTGLTFGLFRWNRNATPDPFEYDEETVNILKDEEQQNDENPKDDIPIA